MPIASACARTHCPPADAWKRKWTASRAVAPQTRTALRRAIESWARRISMIHGGAAVFAARTRSACLLAKYCDAEFRASYARPVPAWLTRPGCSRSRGIVFGRRRPAPGAVRRRGRSLQQGANMNGLLRQDRAWHESCSLGARTTESPSFELNSALLRRCPRVPCHGLRCSRRWTVRARVEIMRWPSKARAVAAFGPADFPTKRCGR
jgi:hypothetical protein